MVGRDHAREIQNNLLFPRLKGSKIAEKYHLTRIFLPLASNAPKVPKNTNLKTGNLRIMWYLYIKKIPGFPGHLFKGSPLPHRCPDGVPPWAAACGPPWPRDAPSGPRARAGVGGWGLEHYFWRTSWGGMGQWRITKWVHF